jgi:hypothetical protein
VTTSVATASTTTTAPTTSTSLEVIVITTTSLPDQAFPLVDTVCDQLLGLPFYLRTGALEEGRAGLSEVVEGADLDDALDLRCPEAISRHRELERLAGWSAELGAAYPGGLAEAVVDERFPELLCDAEGFTIQVANPFSFSVGMLITLAYSDGTSVSNASLGQATVFAPGESTIIGIEPAGFENPTCLIGVESWVAEEGGGVSAGYDPSLGLFELSLPPPATDTDTMLTAMQELIGAEFAMLADPDPAVIAEIEDIRSHNFGELHSRMAEQALAGGSEVFEGIEVDEACSLERGASFAVVAFHQTAGTVTIRGGDAAEESVEVGARWALGVFRRGGDDNRWRWLMTALPLGEESPCQQSV